MFFENFIVYYKVMIKLKSFHIKLNDNVNNFVPRRSELNWIQLNSNKVNLLMIYCFRLEKRPMKDNGKGVKSNHEDNNNDNGKQQKGTSVINIIIILTNPTETIDKTARSTKFNKWLYRSPFDKNKNVP